MNSRVILNLDAEEQGFEPVPTAVEELQDPLIRKPRLAFPPLNRRNFVSLAAGAGVAALAANAVLIEPNRAHLVRREITLQRWPTTLDGFTIALLSDFHYDPFCSAHPLHAAIPLVRDSHPDLIALAGDFVTTPMIGEPATAAGAADPCAKILSQLQAPYGLWAVMGNHDAYTDEDHVRSVLQRQGIGVLNNAAVPVERNGSRFWMAGVGDGIAGDVDLARALAPVPAQEPVVLMAHEPDLADYISRRPVDLQLSGHTHGGQIRLPFLPPLYLPALGRKYVAGLYRIGSLTLYTSLGLGTVGLPARWNCPPEVTVITLRSPIVRT